MGIEQKLQIQNFYPNKQQRENKFNKIKIACNLKKLSIEVIKTKIKKYNIEYKPNIEKDNHILKHQLNKELYIYFKHLFINYILYKDTIFGLCRHDFGNNYTIIKKLNNELYTITLSACDNDINVILSQNTVDRNKIIKKFEYVMKNIIMDNKNLISLDKNTFYDTRLIEKDLVDILNKFTPTILIKEAGIFYNIYNSLQILCSESIYKKLEDFEKLKNNPEQYKKTVRNYIIGEIVYTRYSVDTQYKLRSYKIDDISFDKSISNTSIEVTGKNNKKISITLKEYYSLKYGKKLDERQPLLIQYYKNENTKIKRFLIPELCHQSNLSKSKTI